MADPVERLQHALANPHAHEQGVVHADVRLENVLPEGDDELVADSAWPTAQQR